MSWLKARDWATGVEYSSLFHSGLRAISLRPRARRARACSSSASSREKSANGTIASLSSRILRRRTTRTRHPSPSISTSSSTDSIPVPKIARGRPSSMFVRPTKEVGNTWSSEGAFFDLEKFAENEGLHAAYLLPPIELDTVRSLAGSWPFVVHLGEMDEIAVSPVGPESLLSPANSEDEERFSFPRRERPVSMQTMPLPSRRSSVHYRREMRRERGDSAWMLEESSPELKAYDPGDDAEEIHLDDAEDVADWRQFHVDWVQNMR